MVSLCAPTTNEFRKQLEIVLSYADLRAERANEILSQVVPQTAYWSSIAGLGPEHHRYTLELLGIGLRFAMMVIMKFKLLLNCPRPHEYNSLVQPLILPPGYSAFPSGHATEAYFAAELLCALCSGAVGEVEFLARKEQLSSTFLDGAGHDKTYRPESTLRGQLHRLAFRVAENRVVAGLHFPVDSLAGQLLGTVLARYFVASCANAERLPTPAGEAAGQPAGLTVWSGAAMKPTPLPYYAEAKPTLDVTLDAKYMDFSATSPLPSKAKVLPTLWDKSLREWRQG